MAETSIQLRPLSTEDWPNVRSIYLAGIATGHATFETECPDWDKWNRSHLGVPRLVALIDDVVAGWAALSPVSTRTVYAGVAEVSVYVGTEWQGRGIGRSLLGRLMKESEDNGIWTLQASIFPENVASISLHQSCGFREVGRRERIGNMKGRWRDTILMERRSKIAGSD